MARVKIIFPNQAALFQCSVPVRITDVNYGNHLGNDALLSIIHEARMQLLASWNFSEMNAGGSSLIMADVMIAYKNESFYGDILEVAIYADELSSRSFDLLYHISTTRNNVKLDIAHAKTGMICFDYNNRKVAIMQDALKQKLDPKQNQSDIFQ